MNWSLNYGMPTFVVPAATVGVGGVFIPNENTVITALLTSGTECVDSDCFKDLDDQGRTIIGSIAHQYNRNGLPGGVTGQAAYLFDQDFTELNSLAFDFGNGFDQGTEDESWLVGGSFWQYMSVKGQQPTGPLNLTNKVPDLRGWGIFGRLYFADKKTNPWKTSAAAGVGGRGLFDSRPDDLFGAGLFYNDLSKTVFQDKVDDPWGAEVFYNLEITPAVRFSTNLQYLRASNKSVDDTTLLSARLQVRF